MRAARRFALFASILIVALVIVAFVLENQQRTTLSFFGYATDELPVSVIVVLILIVGMIAGPLLRMVAKRKKISHGA